MLERCDHVIVHDPCYQSLRDVSTAIGCETTKWTGQEQDRWELDLEFLRQQIKRNTRAIIINCPHNPTGYLMDLQKFQQVIQIARECNLLLFSDEVYRGPGIYQDDQLPAACDLYENAISLV
jgi:aspartate/methionine/tyrosine aminotransferase